MAGWFSMPEIVAKFALQYLRHANGPAQHSKAKNRKDVTVTDITQNLSDGAAKMGQDLQEKVNTLATFELEDIGKALQNAEEDIVAEETKIKQEDAGLKQAAVKILPWETRIEDKSIFSHGLMEKILALSLEESNFTTPPPPTAATTEDDNDAVDGTSDGHPLRHTNGAAIPTAFALERHINIAIKMLELDPNLGKVHARLIAKMPEEMFWFHYFSRIETLREEVGLEPLCEDFAQATSGVSSDEYDKISHGDAHGMSSPSDPPQQVGHASDDNADDDFSDLGDLDDLDDDSDPTIDATLEAEIAAEIGED